MIVSFFSIINCLECFELHSILYKEMLASSYLQSDWILSIGIKIVCRKKQL